MSSSSNENLFISVNNSISLDDSITHQSCQSPPPLPPRNTRSVTQSLTGFPGTPSKFRRLCPELRNISNIDGLFDGDDISEGLKSPTVGMMSCIAQPELGGVPEFSEPSIAILDSGGLWPHLEPSFNACMPLKLLELVSPLTRSNVIINELPIRITVHENIESLQKTWKEASAEVWNWYKAPFAIIYIVTADSQDQYRVNIKPDIRQLLDAQESENLMKEGWFILYVKNVNRQQQTRYVKGSEAIYGKIFGWLSADFYVKFPGDRSRFLSVSIDDTEENKQQQLEDYHLTKQWNDIIMQLCNIIVNTFNTRLQMYEADLSQLDERRMDPEWNFSQFFLVKDALAAMLRQFGLNNEALLKYQELAASVIMLSDEVQNTMQQHQKHQKQKLVEPEPFNERWRDNVPGTTAEENSNQCGHIVFGLPSQCIPQPHPVLDLHSMAFRERLLSRTLYSVGLEAELYIFARETQLLLETCSPIEMIGCASSFISAYYQQLLLRNDIVPAQAELWALKASWDMVKIYPSYQHISKKLFLKPPPCSNTETEYSSDKNPNNGGGDGGRGHNEIEIREISAQLCELFFFMIDRLIGCARQLSSFDHLSRSPVLEIYTCGFWLAAQTWTPTIEPQRVGSPSSLRDMQQQPFFPTSQDVISEDVLSWNSDKEYGEVEEAADSITAVTSITISSTSTTKSILNPLRTLFSSPMIFGANTTTFDSRDRLELDNLLDGRHSGKSLSGTSLDLGSFDSLAFSDTNSELPLPPNVDNKNNNRKEDHQQSHCRGLETARDLDLCFLQITQSLVKHLVIANRLRNAAIIQQRRCDVLLSHGKWSVVIRLLEDHNLNPQDTGCYHLLELHRLQRIGQCYWNLNFMNSFFNVVLRMCLKYKLVTTEASSLGLSRSSIVALKRLLTAYVEACSTILHANDNLCYESVNLNLSKNNLAYIATPQLLLLDGGDYCNDAAAAGIEKKTDNFSMAGDELFVTCIVLSHLPCQIELRSPPVLTLKIISFDNTPTTTYCQRDLARVQQYQLQRSSNVIAGATMMINEEDWNSSHRNKGERMKDEEQDQDKAATVFYTCEYVVPDGSTIQVYCCKDHSSPPPTLSLLM